MSLTHDGPPRLPSVHYFPEIAEMQTRAVLQAAIKVRREHNIPVVPKS